MYHTFDIWQQKLWYMGKNLTRFFKAFFFDNPFFCSARTGNIMVSPKNFTVGLTSTSDRPCSRPKKLRLTCFDKMIQAMLSWKSEKSWTGPVFWFDVDPTKNHNQQALDIKINYFLVNQAWTFLLLGHGWPNVKYRLSLKSSKSPQKRPNFLFSDKEKDLTKFSATIHNVPQKNIGKLGQLIRVIKRKI